MKTSGSNCFQLRCSIAVHKFLSRAKTSFNFCHAKLGSSCAHLANAGEKLHRGTVAQLMAAHQGRRLLGSISVKT